MAFSQPDITTDNITASVSSEYGLGITRGDILAIPSIQAMWDASDETSVTYDGSNRLEQINDLTGNGHHFTQTVTANKPQYIDYVGDNPYIEFDGINDFMDVGDTTDFTFLHSTTPHTIYVAGQGTNGMSGGTFRRRNTFVQ